MKRNHLYLTALIILLLGGLMVFLKFSRHSLYDSDHKFRKDITLKQLRSVESRHGDLIGVRYSHGGGMNGDTDTTELFRDENGKAVIRKSTAAFHSFPLLVREYSADDAAFDDLRTLIDRDNLSVWKDLPASEYIVYDAPSTHITMIFDDSQIGGSWYESCTVSFDDVIPEGGRDILRNFTSSLFSYISPDRKIREYFEIDGEPVEVGKETENTTAEILSLLSGNWSTGDNELLFYNFGLDDELSFLRKTGDEYTELHYKSNEIVSVPWNEADCGWYVSLEDDEGTGWVLYIEGISLVLKKCDGSEQYIFERTS